MKLLILVIFLIGIAAVLLSLGFVRGNGWMVAFGGISALAASALGFFLMMSMSSTKLQDQSFNNALRTNASNWANLRKRVSQTLGTRNRYVVDEEVRRLASVMGTNPERSVALSNYSNTVSDNWVRNAERTEINQNHPTHIAAIRENAANWTALRAAESSRMQNPTADALDKRIGAIARKMRTDPGRSIALSKYNPNWSSTRVVNTERI